MAPAASNGSKDNIRDFDSELKKSKKAVSFKMGGQTFKSVTTLHPRWMLVDLTTLKDIVDFIVTCLDKDSRSRFREMVLDPESVIEIDQLYDLTRYLTEQLSDRPTVSPTSPGGGRKKTSPSSKVAALSRGSSGKNSA